MCYMDLSAIPNSFQIVLAIRDLEKNKKNVFFLIYKIKVLGDWRDE